MTLGPVRVMETGVVVLPCVAEVSGLLSANYGLVFSYMQCSVLHFAVTVQPMTVYCMTSMLLS